MPERRRLLQLPEQGHYRLAAPAEFVDLMPGLDGGARRIRLRLAVGIQLDIPMSEEGLSVLAHALSRPVAKGD